MNISSDVIRGYNDTMILYLLWEGPSYGYEISKQIKTLSDGKYIIKETTLYSAFTRMEKNGFIESFSSQSTDTGKRRTYYRITETGRRYYLEKCKEWELTQEVVEKFILKGEWKQLKIIWKACSLIFQIRRRSIGPKANCYR